MAGAVTASYDSADALRLAINAGNDLLMLANTGSRPRDVVQPALDSIEGLVLSGAVDEAQIDRANARIAGLLARLG